MSNSIIFAVDIQKDFINVNGAIPLVPHPTIFKEKIKLCLNAAEKANILIVGTLEAHSQNDREFEINKPHCVIGTEGQDIIPEGIVHNDSFIYTVPNLGNGIDISILEDSWQIFFEKQTDDIWDMKNGQPDNLQTFLRAEDVIDVYIFGVNSVTPAVQGFLKNKYKVTLIGDITMGNVYLNNKIENDDVRMITTEIFIKEINNN